VLGCLPELDAALEPGREQLAAAIRDIIKA
jgi:hypothetical protein